MTTPLLEQTSLATLAQHLGPDEWASVQAVAAAQGQPRDRTGFALHNLWYRGLVEEQCRVTRTGRISKYFRLSRAGYHQLLMQARGGVPRIDTIRR